MQDFQVTFITEENRKHGHRGLARTWFRLLASGEE